MSQPTKTTGWGYYLEDDEVCAGPFRTRQAALAHAVRCRRDRIMLGEVADVVPADWVRRVADAGSLLEDMEEALQDEASFGEVVFVVPKEKRVGAEAALADALAAWAAKYVETDGAKWHIPDAKLELVPLEDEDEDDEPDLPTAG